VRKQLEKVVLTKGAWATLMFLYQELDKASGKFRAPKWPSCASRSSNGSYRKQSSFNVSSEKQGAPDHRGCSESLVPPRWRPALRRAKKSPPAAAVKKARAALRPHPRGVEAIHLVSPPPPRTQR